MLKELCLLTAFTLATAQLDHRHSYYKNWNRLVKPQEPLPVIYTPENLYTFLENPYLAIIWEELEIAPSFDLTLQFLRSNYITKIQEEIKPFQQEQVEVWNYVPPENWSGVFPNHTTRILDKIYIRPHTALLARVVEVDGKLMERTPTQCPFVLKKSEFNKGNTPRIYRKVIAEPISETETQLTPYLCFYLLPDVCERFELVDNDKYLYDALEYTPFKIHNGEHQECPGTKIVDYEVTEKLPRQIGHAKPDNTVRYWNMTCRCPYQCTVFIGGDIQLAIADSRLLASVTKISSTESAQYELRQYYAIHGIKTGNEHGFRPDNYYEWSNADKRWHVNDFQLQPISFVSSLFIAMWGLPSNDSINKIYCTMPRGYNSKHLMSLPRSSYKVPQVVTFEDGSSLVDFGMVNGTSVYGPNPVFLAADTTLEPTEGSCKGPNGYVWNGSFTVIKDENLPFCPIGRPMPQLVCKANKLIQSTKFYIVPRKLEFDPITCEVLCPTKPCTPQLRANPLYQVCEKLVDSINTYINHKADPGVELPQVSYEPLATKTNIQKFEQEVVGELVTKTIHEVKAIGSELDSIVSWLPKFSEKFSDGNGNFAIPEGIAELLPNWTPEFGSGEVWNYRDGLDKMAALPWLVAWRLGRQVNVLGLTTGVLVEGLKRVAATSNVNFEAIKETLELQTKQITNNYNSITNLYNLVVGVTESLETKLQEINYRVDALEYMASKLAQVQQLYIDVRLAAERIKTDIRFQDQRELACRHGLPQCTEGDDIMLNFNRIITPTQDILIMVVLAADECEYVFETLSNCNNRTGLIAPFPCVYQGTDYDDLSLVNKTNDQPCSRNPIQLDTCEFTNEEAFKYSIFDYTQHKIIPQNTTIEKTVFDAKIGDIQWFNLAVNNSIAKIKQISFAGLEMPSQKDIENTRNYYATQKKWTFWDYLRWAFYVLCFSLVAVILAPIIKLIATIWNCCSGCCNHSGYKQL
ncbi:spike protein [Veiled chameleon serpentovirus A]|uniref:Spike protein n=1 Tax=Veiled chameleon serpentovirus A TaxID=2806429 RepID=A0AAE7TSY2_9NIDO|nr:spike protein [Veiled chameleon serpentovirus A]QRC47050.1 spike protein [Veiled chameleon serpentovirus A]